MSKESAKKNYTEPEEKASEPAPDSKQEDINTTPITEIKDPLDEDKISRGHTGTGLGAGGDQPMPEYTINPNISPEEAARSAGADPNVPGAAEEEDMPHYEDLKKQQENMSPSEQLDNANETANLLMDLYGEGWRRIGNLAMEIGEKRMNRIEREAEGILDMRIMYGGVSKPVRQIFQEFDAIAHDKVGGFSEKEKNILRPIIAKELMKRGAVMTPLMYAGVIALKHAIRQITIIREVWMQRNYMIDGVTATYELLKRQGGFQAYQQATAPAQAPPPQQPDTPPPPPEGFGQPEEAMEETTGLTDPGERAGRMFKNIQRGTRQAAKRRKATQATRPDGTPKRKYIKKKFKLDS